MRIINKLEKLRTEYDSNKIVRENGTELLCPMKIPRSRHTLFKGLSDWEIDEFLVKAYKNELPWQYIELIKYTNGFLLFSIRVKTAVHCFGYPLLTLYALPRTQPFGRPLDQEEPFDIRVEDLGRHDDIPKTWLKFGAYVHEYRFDSLTDLFVDTVDGRCYSCEREKCDVIEHWDSIDDCLCALFDFFSDSLEEYEYI